MTKWEQIKSKISSKEKAKAKIETWKSEAKKVVFTNGCFDILHQGHVAYLAKAANLGDVLVVAINDDNSVRRLQKGPNRPINNEQSRALVMASLAVVDLVVVFSEDTPLEIIHHLQPSILVKGADYDADITDVKDKKYIVGANEIKVLGGTVATIDLEEGFSTTNIVSRLKDE